MSNNTTTVPIPASAGSITPFELWMQLTVFYLVLAGIVGTWGHIWIAVVIAKNKDFRSRFFVIVQVLVLVRATIGFQLFISAIFRILRTLSLVATEQKRISCHFVHFFLNCSFTVEIALLVVMVVDRMWAVMAPTLYRRLTKRQAWIICILVVFAVGVCGKIIPSFLGWNPQEVILCLNVFSSTSTAFNNYAQTVDFPIIIMVLSLYAVLWSYVKVHIYMLQKRPDKELASIELKRKTALLPTLRNVVLSHAAITLTSKLLLTLSNVFPQHATRLLAYVGVLSAVDLFVNLLVLMCSNKDLQKTMSPFTKKRTAVEKVRVIIPTTIAVKAMKPS